MNALAANSTPNTPDGTQITITIITERKHLLVKPGPLTYSDDRVEVDVCCECAAVVFDPHHHDKWHRSLKETGIE